MKLSAVLLARVLAYVESADINPRGKTYFPDIAAALVERYRFQKFPRSLEDFNEATGVEFHEGHSGGTVIQKFVIWDSLLVLETRSNTDDSKRILGEMLTWGADKFGLHYQPEMIKHFAYISDLSFYSDAPLLGLTSAAANLASKTSQALTDIWQEPIHYQPVNLQVGHDPTARKYAIAPFAISRRAEAKFSENKYFSEAPLPTDTHIALLEQYERDIVSAIR